MSKDNSFDAMIKQQTEQAVMQAINDLGIRAIMREKVMEAGINKDDIRQMIKDAIDSYVRSVNITAIVAETVNDIIKRAVRDEVKEQFSTGSYTYRPNSVTQKVIEEEVKKALYNDFSFNFSIERKQDGQREEV